MLLLGPGDPKVARMAAVALWMAAWWVTEAIPIPATALLPLVLLPLLGIAPVAEVAPDYGRPTVYLFLGGFLLALGLEGTGVHRRLALFLVERVGGGPRRLLLGFMLASGFVSMWISNTATVMVHLPIALSVLGAARDRGVPEPELKRLGAAIMLAISYAASIGGMATLVGTPPNLAYRGQLTDLFPHAPSPSFIEWMMIGTPLAAVFIALGYFALSRIVFRIRGEALLGSREAVGALRRELGPMRRDEIVVASIFGLTAILWMTQALWVPWARARGAHVDDSVIAIAAALTLFVLPSRDRPGERLLAWRETARLPWGTLLVFGGGFALASGFEASGLSAWLGDRFGALRGAPPLLHMAVLCLAMIVFTEFASNTAATAMALPIVASAAVAAGTDPRYLMIPATFAASCGFMMPVGSPTQTIVFGSGWVPMRDMIRAGIWFNLIGFILIPLLFTLLAGAAMGIEPGILPAWAKP